MTQQTLIRLQYLCDTIPALLRNIPEVEFSHKPKPEKWSIKEVLGHLIDSATCNHQRFIRAQFEQVPTITYDQNNWNTYSHYHELDAELLITFWSSYNKLLIELIKHISPENLMRHCDTGGEESHSLEWLFDDYIIHLEHHLKQMLDYQ